MVEIFRSPFVVPLGAFLVAIVGIVSGVWSQAHARRLKAEQRMAMLARGIPIAEIEAILSTDREAEPEQHTGRSNPARRIHNSRRAGVVLISIGTGLILFFITLSVIVGVKEVLAGAAAGLIPLAIGVGFLVDYGLQRREMMISGGVTYDMLGHE